MRILTLTQPWATLMAIGAKTIETRSWGTKYRGPVAIHASKGPLGMDPEKDAEAWHLARVATVEAGYSSMESLPRGAIVGVFELDDCWPMVGAPDACAFENDHDHPPAFCICGTHEPNPDDPCPFTSTERAFGHYEAGRWGWFTDPEKLVRLRKPLPWKGAQGLRNLDPAIAKLIGSGVS